MTARKGRGGGPPGHPPGAQEQLLKNTGFRVLGVTKAAGDPNWDLYEGTKISICVLVDFWPVSGQSWARDRYQWPRLGKRDKKQ